jgi:2-polyprenyl-3-methyl-5-hydroxy-6-metoxy-1,4-benzoquinol methylase
MPYQLDVELTAEQKAYMARFSAESWFTSVDFKNVSSPRHPSSKKLEANNEMKRGLVSSWIRSQVKGKRVLDLFCANGAFSVEAALAGAREVVGVDFSQERVDCARFLAGTLEDKVDCTFHFMSGDVYELDTLFSKPFDVVIALGGLYHIADPPYVLTKIGELTGERLIMQTSNVLPRAGNWAKFVIREDRTAEGLTSIRGGRGVWRFTVECLRAMLTHAGFEILDERRPPEDIRRRFPWYSALAQPSGTPGG